MCKPDSVPGPDPTIDHDIDPGADSTSVPVACRQPLALSAGVAMITFLLGVARVGDQPLWLDEAASAHVVDRSFFGLVNVLGRQAAGLFSFHVGLWIWAQPFGNGDTALRMFCVVGAAVTAGWLIWLAARWFEVGVAALAGVLILTNPFFLRHLTELRGYSWAMVLSVAGLWALDRLLERDRRADSIVLGVVIGIAVANQVLALVALVPVAVALWVTGMLTRHRLRTHLPTVVITSVALAVFAVPALMISRGGTDWIPEPALDPVRSETEQFLGGGWYAVLLIVGLVAAIWHVVRARPTDWRISAVTATASFTLPLLLALSYLRPMYIARYAAPAFPMLILAAAVGYAAVGRRLGELASRRYARLNTSIATIATLALVAVVAVGLFVAGDPLEDTERATNPRAAVELILDRMQPGELVAVNNFPTPFIRYFGDRPDVDPAHLPPEDRWLHRRKPIEEYIDELRAAPVVYFYGWEQHGLKPAFAELAAEREVTIERFGLATVWIMTTR